MNKPKQRRFTVAPTLHYFTLVELLVVVAIIGILAGMLLPSLNRALSSARAVACMNNARQIGHATMEYAELSHDFLPKFGMGNDPNNNNNRWWVWYVRMGLTGKADAGYQYWQYCKPEKRGICGILYCPAYKIQANAACTYTMSARLRTSPDLDHVRMNTVRKPTRTILLADGSEEDPTAHWGLLNIYSSAAPFTAPAVIHDGGANVLFVSGNVSRFVPCQLIEDVAWPDYENQYVRWSP